MGSLCFTLHAVSSRELIDYLYAGASQISNQTSPLSPRSTWLLALIPTPNSACPDLASAPSSQTCFPPTLRPVLSEGCPTIHPFAQTGGLHLISYSFLPLAITFSVPRHLVRNPLRWMSCLSSMLVASYSKMAASGPGFRAVCQAGRKRK